ncbi:anthocyanidin synthase [Canna indica]|uniref:Anthocyanidin synthase n=1 Tax=Canna indica TaxID=4628 RepID=A0AAQ3JVT1_9LILI|nr:anthocyanidin synthase [Canna indica]
MYTHLYAPLDFDSPNEAARRACAEVVKEAATEWGVMHIVNHDISMDLVEQLRKAGKEFFDLPMEQKEQYANDQSVRKIYGYGKQGSEVMKDFGKQLRMVVTKMLEILSVGLGLEKGKVEEELGGMEDLLLQLKINYYSICLAEFRSVGREAGVTWIDDRSVFLGVRVSTSGGEGGRIGEVEEGEPRAASGEGDEGIVAHELDATRIEHAGARRWVRLGQAAAMSASSEERKPSLVKMMWNE